MFGVDCVHVHNRLIKISYLYVFGLVGIQVGSVDMVHVNPDVQM